MTLNYSSGKDVGHLMNLMSNDCTRFDYGLIFIPYLVIAPLQTLVYIYFLYDEIGLAMLGGIGFVFLIMPLQVVNGHLTARFRDKIASQTDERSRIMNEIVMAIRVIKMMGWELTFANIIDRIRRQEVQALGKRGYLRAFFLSMYTFCNKLTPYLSIMMYVVLGNRISADKAFFTVAVFQNIIESMVFYFSSAVGSGGEVWTSINRLQKFLLLEDRNPQTLRKHIEDCNRNTAKVCLENATASWADMPTLRNINLDLRGDRLVMVIGPVGCGKTSLLHTLIDELELSSGRCEVTGEITYAGQEAWLFAGTVRENILFNSEFDKQRYHEIIHVCCLQEDMDQLPNGDMSLVGERGVSLSGGQRARINLARALYRNTDVVLMDDPLSAVDARVSSHIFDKCIKRYLKGKLRILVTHQLQYLPQADHIVILSSGQVVAQGSYKELLEQGIDFVSLMEGGENANEVARRTSVGKIDIEVVVERFNENDIPEDNIEKIIEGSVSSKTYWTYCRSGDSILGFLFVTCSFFVAQIIVTANDYWLSHWTTAEENYITNSSSPMTTEFSYFKSTSVALLDPYNYRGEEQYLTIYSAIILAVIISTLLRAIVFFWYSLQIGINLHNKMFQSVVRAPIKFFDDNPSGRIMNRFTKDVGSIDELLPPALYDAVEYMLQTFGVVVVVVMSNYYLSIPAAVIFTTLWALRSVYVKTSRDVKRLESVAKSPVFTHLAATMQGLTTIRALQSQDCSIKAFDEYQDIHSSPWFVFIATTRGFAIWIETLSVTFLTVITFTFLLFVEETSAGVVGLVIVSTLTLTTNLQWAMRQTAETENFMTSFERAIEYTELEPEAPWETALKPTKDWPSEGGISFNNVYLAYGDKDVLKNLNFEILPKEKIGIVGRTGAGKSSMIAALFRTAEPRGSIIIDGIRINDVGLHDLRKNISIIPQDPVLFSGTIRYNLDPFDQFNETDIWDAIKEVQLHDAVGHLDARVDDGGSNFSIGQRQLICLARAILRKNRIIVMDEATANVDPRTDGLIQSTIRNKFSQCTIIIIAHRLHSVMNSDKLIVLDNGLIQEYDHPHILLQRPTSELSKLVEHTGTSGSAHLRILAKRHYEALHQQKSPESPNGVICT
ncbi:unnamed protein product [Orchesella dallaii]